MDILLLCDDALNLILKQSENCYCTIVCKMWYELLLQSSNVCLKCNKFAKIYDMELWDNDNDYICHTNPLFIKINTQNEYIMDNYGKCLLSVFDTFKDITKSVCITIDKLDLLINFNNSNDMTFATLHAPKTLGYYKPQEYFKLDVNDFYESIKIGDNIPNDKNNTQRICLNIYNGTKCYFENNDKNNHYLTVKTEYFNPEYLKVTHLKSLNLCNDCPYHINKRIDSNKNFTDNLKTDILSRLPACISSKYSNLDNLCSNYYVSGIGSLTLNLHNMC